MSSKNPDQIQRKRNLFGLIDSLEPQNISLGLAMLHGDRSLYQAAKQRYYPLMRLLDPKLGAGFELLQTLAAQVQGDRMPPWMPMLLNHYADLGAVDIVQKFLRQFPMAALAINNVALLNCVMAISDAALCLEDLNLPDVGLPLQLGQDPIGLQGVLALTVGRAAQLDAFARHFSSMTSLHSLSAEGCALIRLPQQIVAARSLRKLVLRQNKLREFPAEMAHFQALATISLEDNAITHLPEWLGTQPSLRRIDLAGNGISALPMQLLQSPFLEAIDLSNNRLTALGFPLATAEAASQPAMPTQDPEKNQIKGARANAGLRSLKLSHNPLGVLPKAILHLPQIRQLELKNCGLQVLPAAIGRLAHLEELHLANNPLLTLPDEIGELPCLRLLDLRGTNVAHLPASIAQLKGLKQLFLNRKMVPAGSTYLAELEALLSWCEIALA